MNKSELITKMDAECDKSPKNGMLRVICEHMIDFLHTHPGAAEKIDEKKTLAGAVNKMQNEARKRAVGGCGILTDAEGFEIVHRYFEVGEPDDTEAEQPTIPLTRAQHKIVSLFDI